MRKLKKQAEDTRARKAQTKKEKGWVGGSTVPRDISTSTTKNNECSKPKKSPSSN